jgi:hypothetical protein
MPLAVACAGSGGDDEHLESGPTYRVVTFNSGTSDGMAHDRDLDDGYTSGTAELTDAWYGNGLSWPPAIDAAREFFETLEADVVVFQEIFYTEDCADIPGEFRSAFVCEGWVSGDPTVEARVLGPSWQVACNLGKNDKCAAVNREFGSFRGCDSDFCLDGLDGARVPDCGGGSRVGRAVIDLERGGELTLVHVHGTSGILPKDSSCRSAQFTQIFSDLGDGAPAASGDKNLVMGDLNTDPLLNADFDESAVLWNQHVGPHKPFQMISDDGPDAPGSYADFVNIDHVASDVLRGDCWVAGLTEGRPAVFENIYFDHKPVVCDVRGL